MNKTLKKIILIVVVLILIGVGASLFVGQGEQTTNPLQSLGTGSSAAPLTQNASTSQGVADTEAINREFLSVLLNLESIDLNDDIFSEPAFIALVDNTVRLNQPGNEGRPNPFAPIGLDALYQAGDLRASVGSSDPLGSTDGALADFSTTTEGETQNQPTSPEDQVEDTESLLGAS